MSRTARALVVVFLVVLAGCSFTLDQGPTSSPTPDAQEGSPATTPSPDETSPYPPGVDETTVENVTALLEAHTAALNETGYVANGSGNTTIRRSGFLVDVTRDVRVVVANGSQRYFEVRRTEAGPVDRFVQRYANGSVEYRRFEENGNVEFRERGLQSAEKLARVGHLDSFLRGGDFRVVDVREDEEPARVVLRANRSDNETALLSGLPENADRVRSYEARMVVDADGRVRALDADVGFVVGENDRNHTVTFNLTRIGVSNVTRPDWVDERTGGESEGTGGESEGTGGESEGTGERVAAGESGAVRDGASYVAVRAGRTDRLHRPVESRRTPAGPESEPLDVSRPRAEPSIRTTGSVGHGPSAGPQ